MGVPQPFPYQGSKRHLATTILSFLPADTRRVVEPFAGSAAVSLAAAATRKIDSFMLNDNNAPLIELWREIVDRPEILSNQYRALWVEQAGQGENHYYAVRDAFNAHCRPDHLLYLLARCVKAAVRYNAQGQFNQSPDKRRRGMQPDTMARNLRRVSHLFKSRVSFSADDYRTLLNAVQPTDFVYLDPPYQGVSGRRDARYLAGVCFDELVALLDTLNRRGIVYLLSYDGRTELKTFGKLLPNDLNLNKFEVQAGRSAQATLLGQTQTTYESLYLSPALRIRLDAEHTQ